MSVAIRCISGRSAGFAMQSPLYASCLASSSSSPSSSSLSSQHTFNTGRRGLASVAAAASPASLPSKRDTLRLYRHLLQTGRKFQDYNYREYSLRFIRDSFHANAGVTNPEQQKALFDKGNASLAMLQRQTTINAMFQHSPLVIE
ncbi:hypothetical protein CAOG_07408 [Capsaspora owczarzaki ATCC 30864]|uniref:Complex 1 LYR protein domain-containing protein n=1 Tax=Capsaspora owczarzaki (strain ATCC 30864) TaxID=595528 RepID=A0A0D2W075_CAPO3|nr:hypothetical protein CAOG_07408 [Capsaspora owczarzaki ATCC 30864]KJE97572.1 hypothetical protein CAOG_007408 [Capsaspora owczarzaki ATCC 30864]|eukprot:XP_004343267.1 hypothetical protein CAOG_07408 [Capsaspora owczarzaki ATCC 30864]